MKNSIVNWSWDKPTESGFYLACNGDVESEANIMPFQLIQSSEYFKYSSPWPTIPPDELAKWDNSFKFARLIFGSPDEEVNDG